MLYFLSIWPYTHTNGLCVARFAQEVLKEPLPLSVEDEAARE
jgi:hypothetical protein